MWIKEKKYLFVIGLLIVIIGILPLISSYKIFVLPSFIPASGDMYQGIIVITGLLAMLLGKPSKY